MKIICSDTGDLLIMTSFVYAEPALRVGSLPRAPGLKGPKTELKRYMNKLLQKHFYIARIELKAVIQGVHTCHMLFAQQAYKCIWTGPINGLHIIHGGARL